MKKKYEKMKWETNAGEPLLPFPPSRPGRTVEYVKRKRDKKTEILGLRKSRLNLLREGGL